MKENKLEDLRFLRAIFTVSKIPFVLLSPKNFSFLDVNWGSSTQAQTYKTALGMALRLNSIGEHVKNYKPQILVLSGSPKARPPLVDFANLITRGNSLLILGDVKEVRLTY